MSSFSTPAIMLRRIDFGDYDLILTFLTQTRGKISVIAKSAKKSIRRFSGTLELFSILDLVCRVSRKKGLPMLEEAALKEPFSGIRGNFIKTAYASYWAEMINDWMEENQPYENLYHLFAYVMNELNASRMAEAEISVIFQMRFLKLAGLSPNLESCGSCRLEMEQTRGEVLSFELSKGGIACDGCGAGHSRHICLSKGTIKQLRWIESGDLTRASRIRFSSMALRESQIFLEAFVPYHLGKKPRSLTILQQLRN
jgi:DNA repair protein RecO (recombination protein O)